MFEAQTNALTAKDGLYERIILNLITGGSSQNIWKFKIHNKTQRLLRSSYRNIKRWNDIKKNLLKRQLLGLKQKIADSKVSKKFLC